MRRVSGFPQSTIRFSIIGVSLFLALTMAIYTSDDVARSNNHQLGEKIVMEVFHAINQNKTDSIRHHLSTDLADAGLEFLNAKMDSKITDIKKISITKSDVATLIYEAKIGDIGVRRFKFVLDKNNKLIEAELLLNP